MSGKIDLVLFDMDNVLCDYDRQARVARLAELSGKSADSIHAAIFESGFERSGDSGALTSEEYLREFGDRIGYRLSLNEWLDAQRCARAPNHRMLELVVSLRDVTAIAILTNNTQLVTDHLYLLYPELFPLFGSRIYASAVFEVAKPDAACFSACLDDLGVTPDTVLFVDDLAENVIGARNAGLHAHQFTTVDDLRAVLTLHGLLRSN